MEIQYNGLKGTGELWKLNANVVKSGVVISGKINIVKAYIVLGPRHHGC